MGKHKIKYGKLVRLTPEQVTAEMEFILDKHFPAAQGYYPGEINLRNGIYTFSLFFGESKENITSKISIILTRNARIEIRYIYSQPLDLQGRNRNIRMLADWIDNAHLTLANKVSEKLNSANSSELLNFIKEQIQKGQIENADTELQPV